MNTYWTILLQSLLSFIQSCRLAFTEVDHGFHAAWLFWTSNSFGMFADFLLMRLQFQNSIELKLKYLIINWHKAKISIGFVYIYIFIEKTCEHVARIKCCTFWIRIPAGLLYPHVSPLLCPRRDTQSLL